MAGQYIYTTKGYNGGWSANSSDLRRSAGGGSWPSVADGNKSAFYRTSSSTWRRFFSGINSDGLVSAGSDSFYDGFGTGIAEIIINTNGTFSDTFGSSPWDPSGYPDNPDIEINASLTDGSLAYVTGPALNTWHTLNTNLGWSMSLSGGLSSFVLLSVIFRHVPTATELATIPVSLSVNYISG